MTGPIHAHWNLDHGATAADLLSACRRALVKVHSDRRNQHDRGHGGATTSGSYSASAEEEVDNAVAAVQRVVVTSVASTSALVGREEVQYSILLNFMTCLQWIRETDPEQDPNQSPSLFPSSRVVDVLENAIRMCSSPSGGAASISTASLSLSSSSSLSSEGVASLLRRDSDDAALLLLDLAPILFCLDALNVRSVSYAPLPLHPDAPPQQIQWLAGLSVTPVVSAATPPCHYDMATALLLRLHMHGLLWMTWKEETPRLRLVCQESNERDDGVGDGDDASQGRVTLTLGTVIPPSAEPSLERANHPQGEDLPPTTAPPPPPPPLSPWNVDRLVLLETNVDDLTPEHCAFVMELVMSEGCALDAWTTSIGMKKGRSSAQQLSVLCHEASKDDAMRLLFRHSGTLGIRQQAVDRASLHRRIVTVQVDLIDRQGVPRFGLVDVKVGYTLSTHPVQGSVQEEIVSMKAEFDHCRALSLTAGTPIKSIANEAVRLAKEQLRNST